MSYITKEVVGFINLMLNLKITGINIKSEENYIYTTNISSNNVVNFLKYKPLSQFHTFMKNLFLEFNP